MTRIANLGMYDPPWLQAANDALWTAIAERLGAAGWTDVPGALERTRALRPIWRDPGLLLGQTCGYPLMTELRDQVQIVGAPVYDLPGCEGTFHRSVLVVADASPFEDLGALRGRTVAMNGPDSNTGMNLLRHAVAPLARDGRFFGRVVTSGGHLASLDLVRRGGADIAAVDAVTFELARRHHPEASEGLRVLGHTAQSPTLPFITSRATPRDDLERLREAMNAVLAEARPGSLVAKTALRRIEPATHADYEILLRYEAAALAAGYPSLS